MLLQELVGVKQIVAKDEDVQALSARACLFVAAAEVLLKQRLSRVQRCAQNSAQRSFNCAEVLSALSAALPGVDLSHIAPDAVAAGNMQHVGSLLQLLAELSRMPEVFDHAAATQQQQEQQQQCSKELPAGKRTKSPAGRCGSRCKSGCTSPLQSKPRSAAASAHVRPRSSQKAAPVRDTHVAAQQQAATQQWQCCPDNANKSSSALCSPDEGKLQPMCMQPAVDLGAAAAAKQHCAAAGSVDTHQALQQLQHALSSAGRLLQQHSQEGGDCCTDATAAAPAERATAAVGQHQQQGVGHLEKLSLPCDMQGVALALDEMQAANAQLQQLEQHLQLDQHEPADLQQLQMCGLDAALQAHLRLQQELQYGEQQQRQQLSGVLLAASADAANCSVHCTEVSPHTSGSAAAPVEQMGTAGTSTAAMLPELEGKSSSSLARLLHLHKVTQALLAGVQEQQQALQLQQQEAVQLCQQAEAAAAAAAAGTADGKASSRSCAAASQLQAAEQQRSAVQASAQQINAMAMQLQATEQQLLEQQRQILVRCSELASATAAQQQQPPRQDTGSSHSHLSQEVIHMCSAQQLQQPAAGSAANCATASVVHPAENHKRNSCKAGSSSKQKAAASEQPQAQKPARQGCGTGQHTASPCRPRSTPQQLQRCSTSSSRRSSNGAVRRAAAAGPNDATGAKAVAGPCTGRSTAAAAAAAEQRKVRRPAAKLPTGRAAHKHEVLLVAVPDATAVPAFHHLGAAGTPSGDSSDSSWAGSSRAWDEAAVDAVPSRSPSPMRQAAASAAARVAAARVSQELHSQRLMLQQVLKQEAAAARRLQAQRQHQQQDCVTAGTPVQQGQDQEEQQQQQQHGQWACGQQQLLQMTVKQAGAGSQRAGAPQPCAGPPPAAARAASRLRRHGYQQQGAFVRRSTGSPGPVRRQQALCKAPAAAGGGTSSDAAAAAPHGAPAGAGELQLQLSDLQQLHGDYAQVLGVFEELLVAERRGRMEAERDVAQLMQQLRAEGKRQRKLHM
uniref:DUF5745 domain-containing protein n=1 Tax=Tetradesmus obliquus TaxID=3088 RepID=A0A383VIC0_TETOB|eukprot:jgi/Sobl393_1/18428/SZX65277.1